MTDGITGENRQAALGRPWAALLRLSVVLSLALCICKAQAQGFAPYSLAAPAQDVIGDLGGVPVRMPRAFVRLVEYEGDPHWLEKRTGPPPVRTFESKLTSFAILVHMPTMQPLTKENREAYEKRGFWDTEWIDSGAHAGSSLYTEERNFLTPYAWVVPGQEWHGKRFDYEALPNVYGLKGWRAVREIAFNKILDEKNRAHSMDNHHLYFAYEGERIVAFIKCGSGLTSAPGGRNSCSHSFLLLPEMKAEIRIRYPVESLANWREYQTKMRALVLSWRVASGTPEAASSPSPSNR